MFRESNSDILERVQCGVHDCEHRVKRNCTKEKVEIGADGFCNSYMTRSSPDDEDTDEETEDIPVLDEER